MDMLELVKFKTLTDLIDTDRTDNVVVVEIGSHWGQDTVRFIQAFKNVDIYSFEPHPQSSKINLQLIKEALNGKKINVFNQQLSFGEVNFKLYQAAISDTNNPAMDFFCTYREHQESDKLDSERILIGNVAIDYENFCKKGIIAADGSSLNKILGDDKFETIKVKSFTLDNWYQTVEVPHIDLLWIDVQGHEKNVINGAINTLKNVDYIILEVGEEELYEGAMNAIETVELMQSLSFEPIMDLGTDLLFRRKK